MDQRLSLITLGVSDVARSTAFYERLGWKPSGASNEHVTFFQLGGIALGLYGRTALAEDARVDPAGSGFGGVALAFNTRSRADVDTLLAEAEASGATVVKPAEDAFWGGYSAISPTRTATCGKSPGIQASPCGKMGASSCRSDADARNFPRGSRPSIRRNLQHPLG